MEDVNGVYTYYHYSNDLLDYVKNENNVITYYTYNANNDRQDSAYISSLVEVHYNYTKGMLSEIVRDAGEDSTADTLTYTFTYDNFGNTTKIMVGMYTLVTYTYESYNGKLLKTTYGNGAYVENVYDDLDRIVGIKVNGITKYTYAYNGNGDLYSVTDVDNNITVCYNYDSLDRLVSTWQKIGTSVNSYTYYSYDDMGRAYKSDFRLMVTTGGAFEKHKI